MRKFKKLFCLAAVMCIFMSLQMPATAAEWPTKPINMVVAFAAGGNSDYNARAIAKYLGKELG